MKWLLPRSPAVTQRSQESPCTCPPGPAEGLSDSLLHVVICQRVLPARWGSPTRPVFLIISPLLPSPHSCLHSSLPVPRSRREWTYPRWVAYLSPGFQGNVRGTGFCWPRGLVSWLSLFVNVLTSPQHCYLTFFFFLPVSLKVYLLFLSYCLLPQTH